MSNPDQISKDEFSIKITQAIELVKQRDMTDEGVAAAYFVLEVLTDAVTGQMQRISFLENYLVQKEHASNPAMHSHSLVSQVNTNAIALAQAAMTNMASVANANASNKPNFFNNPLAVILLFICTGLICFFVGKVLG